MFKEMIKKNTSEHFLLKQLIKKNFTAKYKDSILGILWSFINPLLTMLLLTAIFSTIFSGNIANYPVYFLAGRCLFDFFSAGTKIAMNSIKGNSGILKRIYVPRYIFAFGGICSEFINFIISLIILVAVIVFNRPSFNFNVSISYCSYDNTLCYGSGNRINTINCMYIFQRY